MIVVLTKAHTTKAFQPIIKEYEIRFVDSQVELTYITEHFYYC